MLLRLRNERRFPPGVSRLGTRTVCPASPQLWHQFWDFCYGSRASGGCSRKNRPLVRAAPSPNIEGRPASRPALLPARSRRRGTSFARLWLQIWPAAPSGTHERDRRPVEDHSSVAPVCSCAIPSAGSAPPRMTAIRSSPALCAAPFGLGSDLPRLAAYFLRK